MIWFVYGIFCCFKLLLVPAYRSTDFEVHRNWLAITHSLPLSKWYSDQTSQWTLDYPPLFAWFEFLLSQVAALFDPGMLRVDNLEYASTRTVLFQRLSVIITDAMLAFGTKECCAYIRASGVRKSSRWTLTWGSPTSVLALLILGNAGLLIVDHIHFQYNGFLFGVLLVSIAKMLQGKFLSSALWFSVLLNLKHIFLYVAPAYGVYLLRNYCLQDPQGPDAKGLWIFGGKQLSISRISKLIGIGGFVCFASFGPFIVMGQFGQVLSRLFPFKRGLCHAYWAPNFWALYNSVDKIAVIVGKRLGLPIAASAAAMTGGLVQEFEHTMLPSISPKVTFICTLVAMLPALIKLWLSPANPLHFVRCIVLCAFSSFMFGWHVHEKAVLLMIIPLSLLAVLWRKEAQIYLLLSTIGNYSLTPLLFTPLEIPLKGLLVLCHAIYAFVQLHQMFNLQKGSLLRLPLLSRLETLYTLGLMPLFVYQHILHRLLFADALPFLPLLLTSVYCAVGITYCWVTFYWHFLFSGNHKRKVH
ncbi:probable dolichyl pyrophosphate Glc1Man9GlcNAc2 alpha-1,3-glucosyltransferase [Neocloeon triangulifer]|uniref:probable dolichyl pyrophosphate Glc1Man9GlcNAc2 alpha-1,3-glucosyltransferase n=1 Tax=Neocloeon triangulifer TaxID=2078957 RepID=UPI00286FA085|nr:probable dolichyl pyrophosphate Glc1Man9GlcNAc2 alpha-1,3-glucosyltransferase [Neocloeon triangulifer]